MNRPTHQRRSKRLLVDECLCAPNNTTSRTTDILGTRWTRVVAASPRTGGKAMTPASSQTVTLSDECGGASRSFGIHEDDTRASVVRRLHRQSGGTLKQAERFMMSLAEDAPLFMKTSCSVDRVGLRRTLFEAIRPSNLGVLYLKTVG